MRTAFLALGNGAKMSGELYAVSMFSQVMTEQEAGGVGMGQEVLTLTFGNEGGTERFR